MRILQRKKSFRFACAIAPLAFAVAAGFDALPVKADSANAPTTSTGVDGSSITWYTVKVPVGNGQTITVKGPPRIAYFQPGGHDNYLTVSQEELGKAVLTIPGATVTRFESNWDAQRQFNAIQDAIAGGKFNVFMVDTLDGDSECHMLTKEAPAANIAVINLSGAICGLYLKPNGRDGVAEGTIAAIGNNNIDAIHDYLLYMVAQNPGPQKVIVVSGAPTHPLSKEIEAAIKRVKVEHPEFKFVAYVNTNDSTIDGYNKLQPLLVAHPDATIIFSAFADLTVGELRAVKEQGRLGKIKIYDQYGSRQIVDAIRRGDVAATTGGFPASRIDVAFAIVKKAFQGQPFPRVVLGDGGPAPTNDPNWSGVNIIDKSRLNTFVPQF